MLPAFASTQKKEKKTVRLTCGVRAGRTARSESSARTPANARAWNRNLGTRLARVRYASNARVANWASSNDGPKDALLR